MTFRTHYHAPDMQAWSHPTNTKSNEFFSDIVSALDLHRALPRGDTFAFLGFCAEEGVKREGKRLGTSHAPAAIRAQLGRLATHDPIDCVDAGNIVCLKNDLENAQLHLGTAIAKLHTAEYLPIVLGGGRDTVWGHYLGIAKAFPKKNITILNFDTHFGMQASRRANSTTPFLQIAKHATTFDYNVAGIQLHHNTAAMLDTARKHRVNFLTADSIHAGESLLEFMAPIIRRAELLYVSVNMGVLQAACAPGVTTPHVLGLSPHALIAALRVLAHSGKVISLDVLDTNPTHDIDHHTSQLAATLIAEFINAVQ